MKTVHWFSYRKRLTLPLLAHV